MKNFWKRFAIILSTTMYFAFCFIFVGCSNNTEENNTKENNAEEKYCSWCDNDPSTLSRFSRIEISTSATCSQGGVAIVKCKCCKRTAEISVPALGHDYKMIKDEATCLQSGNIYYACQRHGCSSQKTEFSIANPLNHRWILTESYETISYNQKKYECAICGKTKTEKTEVDMGKKLKNTQEEFYYATGAAIRIVKQKLKYPSSANFLKENLMEVHYNAFTGYYYVEGAVSAPNAFGVYTDFYFIVKTKIRVLGDKITWYDYDCVLEK